MEHVVTKALKNNVWKLASCRTHKWSYDQLSTWYDRVHAAREEVEASGIRIWPQLERFDCILEGLAREMDYRNEHLDDDEDLIWL